MLKKKIKIILINFYPLVVRLKLTRKWDMFQVSRTLVKILKKSGRNLLRIIKRASLFPSTLTELLYTEIKDLSSI